MNSWEGLDQRICSKLITGVYKYNTPPKNSTCQRRHEQSLDSTK